MNPEMAAAMQKEYILFLANQTPLYMTSSYIYIYARSSVYMQFNYLYSPNWLGQWWKVSGL